MCQQCGRLSCEQSDAVSVLCVSFRLFGVTRRLGMQALTSAVRDNIIRRQCDDMAMTLHAVDWLGGMMPDLWIVMFAIYTAVMR